MSDEQVWDDRARENLREQLRSSVLGELRLGKLEHESILQNCDEVYIEDAPDSEKEEFIQFSAAELERAVAQLEADRETWPEETDCDRLDRVELALQERGIMLWQATPCCDTCTRSELGERIAVIEDRDPGFRLRIRGYSFFIDQNLPESLAYNSNISVYLGYGWLSLDDTEVADEVYQRNALGIGREVCQCLRDEGFEVNWDGNLSRKIGLSLNWQRRTMLQ
jgi:hypothetical protein